jgi:L-threonylcarbamoyladenylate synthase
MTLVPAASEDAIRLVTQALDEGDLAVVPTDTQYALAADALNEDAVLRVFDVKRRGADQALPVCVGSFSEVQHVAFSTPLARSLAERFWPGAVTLVLRARPWMPDAVTAGSGTVAVRCPGADFARRLATHAGPFTVTSANRHGEPAAIDAAVALRALGADVRIVVDGGRLRGVPSTIVDATGDDAKVLREGAVRAADVVEAVGRAGH